MALKLLSESVPKIAGKSFGRKNLTLGRIFTQWEDIMGGDYAGRSRPLRISARRVRDARPIFCLHIAIASSDAPLFTYQKDLILQRIAVLFGDGWISRLEFEHMNEPVSPRAAKEAFSSYISLTEEEKKGLSGMLETVGDPEIRDRLRRFGEFLMKDLKKNKGNKV